MKLTGRISLFLAFVLLGLFSNAQVILPGSNFRQKTVILKGDSLQIDTLSIIPRTLIISRVPPSDYRLDFVHSIVYFTKRPESDTIYLSYRVFPYKLNPIAQRINFDSIINRDYIQPFTYTENSPTGQRGMFDFGSLKANGSFGRQIAFGNSQDAVVNSTLNMQLEGMLGDSIEIQAAITDNNIPIQPDGNTQQLNEFDQVFLQFKKRGWQLSLGDIDIRQNKSYFLNFYKRLQGVAFQTTNKISKSTTSNTLVSGSIAKGKFNRNVFQGLEGNQGPYRMTGANNEIFFIILSGTERVFIDGELLQRGEDQDYVINYNTAEVTFTPKRMITKDSRIQVEFEYADRNYLNANIYVSEELEIGKKLKLRIGAFNNSDAKNSQINQILDNQQKQFLSSVGDSIQNALYPTATLDTFAAGKVLYAKIYFNNGNSLDSFYQYSAKQDSAKYNVSFSEVGAGRGNYVTDFNGANGKVYKFVPPVGNTKQGQFEPVTILVTPKKQQIVNLGIDYAMSKNTLLKTELAMSSYDANTFSKFNNGDDLGFAAKFQLSNTKQLAAKNKLQLITGLDYEYVQDKFKPLERIRNVEFTRDWGLPLQQTVIPVTENIIKASAQLKNENNHSVTYRFTNYTRSDSYNGIQNSIIHKVSIKGWQFNNQFIVTNFNTQNDKGVYLRPVIDLSKLFPKIYNYRIGFNYALEQNKTNNKLADTLTPVAFSFDTYSVYLKSDENKKNKYGITFFTRADKYPYGKSLIQADRSLNMNLKAELLKNPEHQFTLDATFRRLKVNNKTLTTQQDDNTILGRAQYVVNKWKGLLTGDVLYESGSGQEQKRDFAYLEVPAGQGQYVWNDYDSNGVQSLNEFELAAFSDQAKFIRILTPTNQFIKANYTTINYSLGVNPRALLSSPDLKGMSKWLSRLNFQSSMQISKKSVATGDFEFNPFKYNLTDTALITLTTTLLNALSFNRYSNRWGLDLSNLRNSGKSLLTYGYESRKQTDWTFKLRWNITKIFTLTIINRKGLSALYTPAFDNKNYELGIYSVEPRLDFINGTSFRLSTGYKLESKKNKEIYGGEKSTSNAVNVETKYNILQSSSVSGKFTLNNINYKTPSGASTENSTVGYTILDGLLPGKNYIWNITVTKRLLNNLELSVQYDGRKPATGKTVHVGKASLTALF
ncbi:MAG: hypothetical protein JWM28_255 [Chitinophagaceae bacterium]|nr:hypothetical protein [Chitinophagaceae bacterium]